MAYLGLQAPRRWDRPIIHLLQLPGPFDPNWLSRMTK